MVQRNVASPLVKLRDNPRLLITTFGATGLTVSATNSIQAAAAFWQF